MKAKLASPLLFFVLVGCAAQPVTPPAGAPSGVKPQERPALARSALAPAIAPHAEIAPQPGFSSPPPGASLPGPSPEPMDEERQIEALKTAIALYAQFLERAEGRPELGPAVAKSRERIEDARATITFLEAGLQAKRSGNGH